VEFSSPSPNSKMLEGTARQLLHQLPRIGVRWAFCYGSSFLESAGNAQSLRSQQVDVILVVKENDLSEWHSQNLQSNPQHYSLLWRLVAHPQRGQLLANRGLRLLTRVHRYGPGVWYHPYIPVTDLTFKYGVVADSDFLRDLTQWSYLYLAGRLHKPVLEVHSADTVIASALYQNRLAAAAVSLLLHWTIGATTESAIHSAVEEPTFYNTVARLSYLGDVRVGIAEDPLKVSRIVTANLSAFQAIYRPILTTLQQRGFVTLRSDSSSMWHLHPSGGHDRCRVLFEEYVPKELRATTLQFVERDYRHQSRPTYRSYRAEAPRTSEETDVLVRALRQAIRQTVVHSSRTQTLKGLLTAGPLRSLRYVLHKLRKRLCSDTFAARK